MKIKIATGLGVKTVNAEFAFSMYGHDFYVHNDITDERWGSVEYWCCTHKGTGRKVTDFCLLSKEEAIKESMIRLNEVGEEGFKKGIRKAVNKNKKLGLKV